MVFYALCLLYETVLFCSIICLSARAIYVLFIAGAWYLFVEGNFTLDEGIARITGFIYCQGVLSTAGSWVTRITQRGMNVGIFVEPKSAFGGR